MIKCASENLRVGFFLCAILGLLYWQTLAYPFQFDDYNVIVNHTSVHGLQAWWQSMSGMRPLLKLTYALNWQLDSQPNYFRLFNLCCHFATSFLVFVFVKKLLPNLTKSRFTQPQQRHIALLTAVLFALHPAHTEVVIYISSRSTGLMSLLSLVSLNAYLGWLTQKNHQARHLWLAMLWWFAAVLVKEVALILPVLAVWITYFVAPHKLTSLKNISLKQKLLLLAGLLIPLLWVLSIPQYARLLAKLADPQLNQLLNQPYAHFHYLAKTFFGIGLNVDYSAQIITNPQRITAGFGLIVLLYFCWHKRKQWPEFSFAAGWWFVCLLPSNAIIYRPDLINDRQIYLASVGMLLLVGVVMVRVFQHLPKKLSVALLLLAVFYFGLSSWQRSADYQTEISLWQSSLRQNRYNARAWNNLGYAYQLAGENAKAKDCYENALTLNAKHQKALHNLQVVNGFLKEAK